MTALDVKIRARAVIDRPYSSLDLTHLCERVGWLEPVRFLQLRHPVNDQSPLDFSGRCLWEFLKAKYEFRRPLERGEILGQSLDFAVGFFVDKLDVVLASLNQGVRRNHD